MILQFITALRNYLCLKQKLNTVLNSTFKGQTHALLNTHTMPSCNKEAF